MKNQEWDGNTLTRFFYQLTENSKTTIDIIKLR